LKNLTLQQKFKNDEIISTLRKKLENDKDNKLLSALITMLMSFSIMKNKIDNIEPYKILNMISYLNNLVEKTENEKK
jgi:Zn-dependent M16 (insulinase) family peptidase